MKIPEIKSPQDIKNLNIHSLKKLARDLRVFLINSVSKTGGHLSSNLGVVELTLGLHYVFDSPTDKILWDVGHQCYTHKILTGRADIFDTLRQEKGLSGFPKIAESPHDHFDTGHASTALSSAMGLCAAKKINKQNHKIIAVIGDGSLTGGMAYEALNHIGGSGGDVIVILNDNQMSIGENVGGLSNYLNNLRINPCYIRTKKDVKKLIKKLPLGDRVSNLTKRAKDTLRYFLLPGTLFEEMGFRYAGPIDGHNIKDIIQVLSQAKKIKGPTLLHFHTKKGKGYMLAESNPTNYHGVGKFSPKNGLTSSEGETYSEIFGKTLTEAAKENDKIIAITAAMEQGTGLTPFRKAFPHRFFDVGIAEAHGAAFAAALAKEDFVPVFALYSSFLQRAYDQVIHDVCLSGYPVVFALDRAGIVGEDGETHQGVFDIAFLSHIPGMTVISPKNKKEFIAMLHFALNFKGPVVLRYPKGRASEVLKHSFEPIEYGKSETIHMGAEIALISFGHIMERVHPIYEKLSEEGYRPTLINARFAVPIDKEMIKTLDKYEYVFTFEEHVKDGGFGSIVLNALTEENVIVRKFHSFALPKAYIEHGKREDILDKSPLGTDTMYNTILEKLEKLGKN